MWLKPSQVTSKSFKITHSENLNQENHLRLDITSCCDPALLSFVSLETNEIICWLENPIQYWKKKKKKEEEKRRKIDHPGWGPFFCWEKPSFDRESWPTKPPNALQHIGLVRKRIVVWKHWNELERISRPIPGRICIFFRFFDLFDSIGAGCSLEPQHVVHLTAVPLGSNSNRSLCQFISIWCHGHLMCAWLLMASGMAACLHVGRERGAGGMLQYCNTAILQYCNVAMLQWRWQRHGRHRSSLIGSSSSALRGLDGDVTCRAHN